MTIEITPRIEELMGRVRVFLEDHDDILVSEVSKSMPDVDPFELAVALQE